MNGINCKNNPQIGIPDLLDFAGTMLDRIDVKDISAPGYLEVTGTSRHGMPTASGLNDYDYQNLSSLSLGHKQLNQLTTLTKVPIPSEVLEHFKHIKCHCMMGLFPEIGRAWLTIDSEIYIWTYEQNRDVAYYDGLNQLIVSVALVKPKPEVFIKDVKYLLVLATPTDIVVLGVTFGDTTKTISSPARNMHFTAVYEEMQLMNKPIFILNTDNVAISTIQGTECGRIFLGGRDGCLYEIDYQAESSWFGKRCRKINHSQGIVTYMVPNFLKVFMETDAIAQISIDNHRKLVYVLTDNGAIEVFEMGADSYQMRKIFRLSQVEITKKAINIIKTVDSSLFHPIKYICPLTDEDSPGLHLLAISKCGVRLLFSTISLRIPTLAFQHQGIQMVDTTRPNGLFLVHVRLPPGYTPSTPMIKPKNVHSAYYNEGTLLLVSTPQQDQDMLWSISSAAFPNRPYLAESTTVIPLDGIVWSIAELQDRKKPSIKSSFRNAKLPKKVALLTNQGAHIIGLLKPADILRQLLVAFNGPHHDAVKEFFKAQSESEACATSLIIACSEEFQGTDIGIWAAQAFMLYGGEPTCHINPIISPQRNFTGMIDNRQSPQMFMSTPVFNRNSSYFHSPHGQSSPLQQSHLTQAGTQLSFHQQKTFSEYSNIVYSAKHDGLYLYVARLLRPIWKMRCISKEHCSSITQSDCTMILEDLTQINRFLSENSVHEQLPGNVRPLASPQTMFQNDFTTFATPHQTQNAISIHQVNNDQAQAEEKKSLTALNYFIKHTCEVISLWKILAEHQFETIFAQLSKEQQNFLTACTFRDLTLTRPDSCNFVILGLLNSYLNDNATVSAISNKLREVCPNLYRHEDAISFKATEILMISKTCTSTEEKEERLRVALQLCKDAAPNIPLSNICQQFTLSGFYKGVVELAALCCAKIDPEGLALHFYRNNEPSDDHEGFSAFAARMSCYSEVKQMLDIVYQNLCNASASADFQQSFGMDNQNPVKDSKMQIMQIVGLAVKSSDPLLHVIVYEWLLAHDFISELLALSEPSLGEFLRRSVVRNPENLQLIDLLWKYYEKNGQHSSAAKILYNLASMQAISIELSQRIEYLARAVMCMRNDNVGYSQMNGVLLKDLEDKLEIARVQKIVLEAIEQINSHSGKEAISRLNNTLFDITQLYSEFAEPFKLWECQLTILNCSNHNDPLLIESVWKHIIRKSIEESDDRSSKAKATRLLSKVYLLAKEFRESVHCFPLPFIIRELEVRCCKLKLDESTVPDALIGMQLNFELLIDNYGKMLSMNERIWANEGNEWHLVKSATKLVSLITSNTSDTPARTRRRIIGKAQDLISSCLNVCYQKPDTESLTQSLRQIQSQIQRIQ